MSENPRSFTLGSEGFFILHATCCSLEPLRVRSVSLNFPWTTWQNVLWKFYKHAPKSWGIFVTGILISCFVPSALYSYVTTLFTPLQRSWNGVVLAGCASVRFFRSSLTKCTIVYRNQTAELRNTDFGTSMHYVMVRMPADFHSNRQRPWPSLSRSKIRIEYIWTFVHDCLANNDRSLNCCNCQHRKSHVPFDWHV